MKRKQETCSGEETVKRVPSAATVPPDQYLVQPQQLATVQLLTTGSAGSLVGVPSGVSTVGALTIPPAVAVTVQTEQGAVAGDPCILGGTVSCTQPAPHSSACSFVLTSQPYVTSAASITDTTSTSNTISADPVPPGTIFAATDNTIISFASSTSDTTPESYNNSPINNISNSVFSCSPVNTDTSYSTPFVSSSPPSVSTESAPPSSGTKSYAYKKVEESPAERQQRLSERFNALIRAKIIELVTARGIKKTVCPSEVARALSPRAWRDLMPNVRKIGAQLVKEGLILVTQRGTIVDLATVRGPVRFGLAK